MTQRSPFSLQDKSILVTGGSSGIGLGQALRFLDEGARVAIVDLQYPPAAAEDAGAVFLKCDMSQSVEVIQAFDAATAAFGLLDVISHNAAKGPQGVPLTESQETVLDAVVALNFYGVYYVLKYGPRHLRDGGSIITTASVAGLQQNAGFYDYSATKAATISLTKTAAVELGLRGIRCNTVAPGPVRTPMLHPDDPLNALAQQLSALGRIAEVDDLVGVYHFLASDQSKYMTGQTLIVDGGRLAGYRADFFAALVSLTP